jgi:hypothetical protein
MAQHAVHLVDQQRTGLSAGGQHEEAREGIASHSSPPRKAIAAALCSGAGRASLRAQSAR